MRYLGFALFQEPVLLLCGLLLFLCLLFDELELMLHVCHGLCCSLSLQGRVLLHGLVHVLIHALQDAEGKGAGNRERW